MSIKSFHRVKAKNINKFENYHGGIIPKMTNSANCSFLKNQTNIYPGHVLTKNEDGLAVLANENSAWALGISNDQYDKEDTIIDDNLGKINYYYGPGALLYVHESLFRSDIAPIVSGTFLTFADFGMYKPHDGNITNSIAQVIEDIQNISNGIPCGGYKKYYLIKTLF